MNFKIASQDIDKAALNFADALEDNLAFVSWETVPGKFSKHLNGLENAVREGLPNLNSSAGRKLSGSWVMRYVDDFIVTGNSYGKLINDHILNVTNFLA